ncbi:MAG: hypothetical protein QOE04_5359, partial [Mycobacterium sp.]|nr:hypothetical protein [Mycobacterium sp.]
AANQGENSGAHRSPFVVDFCSLTEYEVATMAPNRCHDIGLMKRCRSNAVDPMRTLHRRCR